MDHAAEDMATATSNSVMDKPPQSPINDCNSDENNDNEPIHFLSLPLEIRRNIYQYLYLGEDIPSTAFVPRRSSQVHVGISTYLPGSNILAVCKKTREEGRAFLFGRIHFTAQNSCNNGFAALRRFNWHKTSMALVQSLDLHTDAICDFGQRVNGLHLLVEKMPNLKYLRISTAFRGDMIDDTLASPRGEDLFRQLPYIQACLLRFGSFVTLRHPLLRTLAWSKPTGDTHLIDNEEGVVHYAIKLVAESNSLRKTDKILSSSAIRYETFEGLALVQAKDFINPPHSVDSEGPLHVSHDTNQSHRMHLAASGIEHLVYLTAADRRRFGLQGQLDFDQLIGQAKTGLLTSTFSPIYPAIQLARASIAEKERNLSNVATEDTLHVLSESARNRPDQLVAATSQVQYTGSRNRGRGRGFKRGDLVEYMMSHTDYLDTINEAFPRADLPEYLGPVKEKKKRGRKSKQQKPGH